MSVVVGAAACGLTDDESDVSDDLSDDLSDDDVSVEYDLSDDVLFLFFQSTQGEG